MFSVYVLRSAKTGRRYVGSCADLDVRLSQHNSGQSKSTRHGVPWHVVYSESQPTRGDAVRRERYLKTGRGREELDEILRDGRA